MALYPHTFEGKETLQPGARGEYFQADLPGYRGGEKRINRTNMKLSASQHDVPNIKWELDARLPVLFRYGFAHGYNQVVMPKGRIVALDPSMNQFDFETHKSNNVLTLANGGVNVELDSNKVNWVESSATMTIDPTTGKVVDDKSAVRNDMRVANKPIGVIQRSEYTRDNDAYNGMQPGAVLTDALIELPLFADKDKAEQNPWGSIYGNVLPGDYVKSDANGRFVPSKLNDSSWLGTATAGQIEAERQQVVGQVYEIQRDLIPAGAAKYAQWALSDRMKFDQFNPEMWRANNRRGEDNISNSPYYANGGGAVNGKTQMKPGVDPFEPKGYPYDQTMTQHDLHMLASSVRKADNRFGLEHQLENGIPGLTDGYNAVERQLRPEVLGDMRLASSEDAYVESYLKLSEVNVSEGSVELAITTQDKNDPSITFTAVKAVGQELKLNIGGTTSEDNLVRVKYLDELQGFLVLEIIDKKKYHTFLTANGAGMQNTPLNIIAKFKKRGLSGVPTFLDWDGCMGYAAILLQK